MYDGEQPFSSSAPNPSCPASCSPMPTGVVCAAPGLVTSLYANGCTVPCELEDINFLNCYIAGFSGKLGLGGSESSVSIDLVERSVFPCPSSSPCPVSQSPPCDASLEYSGKLGHLYTFQVGSFCFTGILANHTYSENDGGYRYKVMLTDGRQALSNVTVILNGYYADAPTPLKPNIINALYELEKSVGDDTCGNGLRCNDFVKSGANQKGIFLKKALEAVNQKICQLPISNTCLIIDVTKIIEITSSFQRSTSVESNVLELITLACEESGHDFFIRIVGNTIEAVPVNKKEQVPENALFNFMETLSQNNPVSDREYGQELTFEKSKKLIIGDNYHYLVLVDGAQNTNGCNADNAPSPEPSSSSACAGELAYGRLVYSATDDPSSQIQSSALPWISSDPACTGVYTP